MRGAGAVLAIIVVVLLLGIAAPLIIAVNLGILFGLPFWPSFWLAFGVGLLVSGTKVSAS